MPIQPGANRLRGIVSRSAPRSHQRTTDANRLDAIAPSKGVPSEHRREQVQRRRQVRTRQNRPLAGRIEVRNPQRRLHANVRAGADSTKECKRLAVTAKEDVLAVIDPLPGCAIDERRRSPAQLTPGFQHDHALSRLREQARRRQPRHAAADHGDIDGSRERCRFQCCRS